MSMSVGTTTKNVCWTATAFLVEHAATLLAVYNGEQSGGTAATIRYAQKMSREIMVINPITLLVTYGGI